MKAKVFISHAASDESLASQLAEQLERAGLEVLNPYEEIVPGENWAEKVAHGLEESDFMLIVITPGAMKSEWLRNDINYALSSKKFRDRLVTVLVGPTMESPGDVPWILLKYPHKQVASPAEFPEVVDEIMGLATP